MGRIRVSGGSPAAEETFYTAVYHSLLHPNVFSDTNGEYLGEDGRIHMAAGYTHYTNFSGWDIYRGEMQLLALLAPQQASDMIRSLIDDGAQVGKLPRWLVANAETGLTVGDLSDAIIADAYAFGARDFDLAITLDNGSTLTIAAKATAGGRYIRSLTVNGRTYDSSWLPLSEIAAGGTLQFTLGQAPSPWATSATSTPPSFVASK